VVAFPVGYMGAKLGRWEKTRKQEMKLLRAVVGFRLFDKIIKGIITHLKVKNAREMMEERREK
jgi:hypothetical protein